MASIQITKFKVRRGLDSQRKSVILDEGELGYTVDTRRVFVGTGTLSGGIVVGSKVHPVSNSYASLSNTNAQVGDLVYANNQLYQLTSSNYNTISSWSPIGPKVDTTYFELLPNNYITLKDNGILPIKINSSYVTGGIKIDAGLLKINYDSTQFKLSSSNVLQINNQGVTEFELASASFTNGLSGGNGTKVGLKLASNLKITSDGKLDVSTLSYATLTGSWIGAGLKLDSATSTIRTAITGVNSAAFDLNANGTLDLKTIGTQYNEMAAMSSDSYGRITSIRSSIYDVVSAFNPLSSTETGHNGAITKGLTSWPSVSGALTTYYTISSNGSTSSVLVLSSAGFMLFEGNTSTRQGDKIVGRFAIPVYAY
jgi:hypothetical protein